MGNSSGPYASMSEPTRQRKSLQEPARERSGWPSPRRGGGGWRRRETGCVRSRRGARDRKAFRRHEGAGGSERSRPMTTNAGVSQVVEVVVKQVPPQSRAQSQAPLTENVLHLANHIG